MSGLGPVHELLPHAHPMVLLDSIEQAAQERMVARLEVRQDGLFDENGQVPVLVGIEYMAQTIAAWAGYHARMRGEEVQPGLLLGTRDFRATRAAFDVGERLEVTVDRVTQSAAGLAVFDCRIESERTRAEARLTVLTVESLDDLPSY